MRDPVVILVVTLATLAVVSPRDIQHDDYQFDLTGMCDTVLCCIVLYCVVSPVCYCFALGVPTHYIHYCYYR